MCEDHAGIFLLVSLLRMPCNSTHFSTIMQVLEIGVAHLELNKLSNLWRIGGEESLI